MYSEFRDPFTMVLPEDGWPLCLPFCQRVKSRKMGPPMNWRKIESPGGMRIAVAWCRNV